MHTFESDWHVIARTSEPALLSLHVPSQHCPENANCGFMSAQAPEVGPKVGISEGSGEVREYAHQYSNAVVILVLSRASPPVKVVPPLFLLSQRIERFL